MPSSPEQTRRATTARKHCYQGKQEGSVKQDNKHGFSVLVQDPGVRATNCGSVLGSRRVRATLRGSVFGRIGRVGRIGAGATTTDGGTTAVGTPPPLHQHDPLRAGLAGSENSDDQTSSTSLPVGQGFNTAPPVIYASALGQDGIFFYTPPKVTRLSGTTVSVVPLFPVSIVGTPTFSFGAGTSRPKATHSGTTGGPTTIPALFAMPHVHSRPVTHSIKR
ncbi:hypothetical protein R1flu_008063 [Riccia fluitans]|uniref:Uncharacterized protein n=1 Tax=Riccia fluitans TaxID=41844 RepID=A0ABD1YAM2_9MARC